MPAFDTWLRRGHNRPIMSRNIVSARLARCLALLLLGLVLWACAARGPTAVDLELGRPMELEGWMLTVKSVRWLDSDVYRKPSSGHGFLAVELALENTTAGIRYVMPERQILVLGPDGSVLQPHPSAGVLAAKQRGWLVVQGEIDPGQTLAGAVSYEVPLDLSGWQWVFRPRLLGSRIEAILDLEGLSIP